MPLLQLAEFSVPDARMLVISPYEKTVIEAIEKAITDFGPRHPPTNDGIVIRLSFPPLTEERRKDLVKVVRHKAEEGRIADPQRAPARPPGARAAEKDHGDERRRGRAFERRWTR